MKPTAHVIASSSLAVLLWLYTKSLIVGVTSFVGGLFLDVDHIIDYIGQFGWRSFTFKRCYQVCVQTSRREGSHQFKKLYLIFHSLELAILLCYITVFAKNIFLFAFTIGYSIHLILDCMGNGSVYFYLISLRAFNKFSLGKYFSRERNV